MLNQGISLLATNYSEWGDSASYREVQELDTCSIQTHTQGEQDVEDTTSDMCAYQACYSAHKSYIHGVNQQKTNW